GRRTVTVDEGPVIALVLRAHHVRPAHPGRHGDAALEVQAGGVAHVDVLTAGRAVGVGRVGAREVAGGADQAGGARRPFVGADDGVGRGVDDVGGARLAHVEHGAVTVGRREHVRAVGFTGRVGFAPVHADALGGVVAVHRIDLHPDGGGRRGPGLDFVGERRRVVHL